MNDNHRISGFTFLELMVALAIIAIGAAMSFPTLQAARERGNIKRAGRDIVSNLQTARIGALKEGRDWAVQFVTAANKQGYKILSQRGPDGKWNTADDVVVKQAFLADYKKITFGSAHGARPGGTAADDGISFGNNRVEFNPDGTSSPSGTVYVRLEEKYTFAVGSLLNTGRIKTWVNYGSGWEDK